MSNPIIQTDIADILQEIKSDQKELKSDQKEILKEVNSIKLAQAKLEGKIEAVDEKLSGQIKALDTKVDQLNERIRNSELTNRGVLIGLVVIILGGAAKLFGLAGNS